MRKKLRAFGVLTIGVLTVLGLAWPSAASATVPGVNSMVSINQSGTNGGNLDSYRPYMSGDGRFVAFDSSASNLVSSDTNNQNDIFERNLASGVTTRVSVSSSGVQANASNIVNAVSRTGRYILFRGGASNLIDGSTISSSYYQLYMRDTATNTTTLISQNSSGDPANNNVDGLDVSSDGRFVLLDTAATNLGPTVTNTGNNLYMFDRDTGTFTILNKAYDGSLPNTTSWTPFGHMSCDGSLVAFQSAANLTTTSSSHVDIYLLDLRSGNHLTDLTASANTAALDPTISCNGDYVGLLSAADNLDTSITDTSMNNYHAYAYNRVNGTFSVVDQSSSGTAGNLGILYYPLSGSEQYMGLGDNGVAVFQSPATNLVSGVTSGHRDVYVHSLATGATELLSRNSSGTEGDADSTAPTISVDGKIAAYPSNATNLVAGDTNGYPDAFTSETGY